MTLSILVPVSVVNSVSKRISRLASDCGVSLEFPLGSSVLFRLTDEKKVDLNRAIECARITVGDMPKFNGYQLIGKLTHTEAGNIVSMAPDAQEESTPEEWRTAKNSCDHCKKARSRAETFIIRCPDETVKRVGRNCLADFLSGNPASMLSLALFQDIVRDVRDGDEWSGGAGGDVLSTLGFITYAVASVEKHGFFKSKENGSTASHCIFLSNPCPGNPASAKDWKECQPTAEHAKRAEEVLAWIRSSKDSSDYMHNMRVACANDATPSKFYGLLASAPQAYNRYLGFVAERQARAEAPDAGYVGEVGARIEVTATIVRIKAIESDFGSKLVVSMKTTLGHDIVTFTTGRGVNSNDTGKTFIVRGTVKKHTQYQGRAQTDLSRCKFSPA